MPADAVLVADLVLAAGLHAGWESLLLSDLAHAQQVRFLPHWARGRHLPDPDPSAASPTAEPLQQPAARESGQPPARASAASPATGSSA